MKQLRQYGFLFLVLIPMFSFVESSSNAAEEQERPMVLMAYYVPEKECRPRQLPLNQLTHILFSFTHIIDGKMKFKNEQIGSNSPFTEHHRALGQIEEVSIKARPAADFMVVRKEANKTHGYTYKPRSIEKIADYCIANGPRPAQIVIDAAFYSRAKKGVPLENNGRYRSSTGSYIGWSAYGQIRTDYESHTHYI